MSKKIKDKVGIAFHSCPHFKDLRSDDTGKLNADSGESNRLTKKEFEETVKKQEEQDKKKKQKVKATKKPSVKEVKDMLKKIIAYHRKAVNDMIPSVYPILGPVNMDDDGEDGNKGGEGEARGGVGMSNTKGELRRYNV